jgi:hypothetical protein
MAAALPNVPQRPPRQGRYLIPPGTPRRAEILAAAAVAALLAGVLFAQLTLVLAVVFHAFSKLSRLRPQWLAVPAAAGAACVLAAGPRPALAGFCAAPARVAGLIAGVASHRAGLPRLSALSAVIAADAPRQFPAALILAAGIAAAAWWAGWLHTSEWDLPAFRAGVVAGCRLRWTVAFTRHGGVVTRDGVCLGADLATGRPAAVSWREAAGGVLVTGADAAAVAAAGFRFAHAAIRRRMPVLVVDLAGDPALPAAVAAVCAAVGAPLVEFGPAGAGGYEPFHGSGPDRAADLLMGIADWDGVPGAAQRACRDCLVTAFGLLGALGSASAAPGGTRASVLHQVAGLLRPDGMRAAAARVPAWHPGREALASRAGAAQRWLAHDPATAARLAAQLTALGEGDLGRWLSPGRCTGPRISLGDVIRERAVALFPLGSGTPAGMIASLLALDLAGRYAGPRDSGTAPDGLAWFSGCEALSPAALAALVTPARRDGASGGLIPVLAATSPRAAGCLAGRAGACLAWRLGDRQLAGRIAALTGTRYVRAGPAGPAQEGAPGAPPLPPGVAQSDAVPTDALCALPPEEFVLVAGRRVVERGRFVRADPS